MRAAAPTLALVLLSSNLSAQPPQAPVFRGGVEIIEVDVSVVDGRGKQVTDIRGPEFTVTIDGKPRKIVNAEFVSLKPASALAAEKDSRVQAPQLAPERAESTYTSNAGAERGRLILLVVDSGNTQFGEGAQVLRAAGQFIDRLGPTDKVAFFTIPHSPNMVDFTSDHRRVRNAVTQAVGQWQDLPRRWNIGMYEAVVIEEHSDARTEAIVMDRFCPQNSRTNVMMVEACKSEVRSQAVNMALEVRDRVQTSLRALRSLLESLIEIDGPKSLVWISQGLPLSGAGAEMIEIGQLAARARTTLNVILLDAPMLNIMEADKSPSELEDRDLERRGLELMAAQSRGVMFPISVNPEAVFQRIEDALAGYYLLAVESGAADRDGKRHSINVSVRRQGMTVRARREFFNQPESAARPETANARLIRTLRSPFAVGELPMRMSTYAYQDPGSAKVRIVVATEIEREKEAGATPAEVSIGMVLTDANGKVVADNLRRAKITPIEGPKSLLMEDALVLALDPGSYTLKVAAVDDRARRGSLERTLTAFQLTGVPFAVSDLMLGDSPQAASDPLHPAVEARLMSGQLAAYLEIYADRPDFFDTTQVKIEISADESGPPLRSGIAQLTTQGDGRTRFMSALMPMENLPPDTYLARAIVTHGDQKVGQLVRPFRIESRAAGTVAPIGSMVQVANRFQREAFLAPDVIAFFMDLLDRKSPALKAATAQVRRGRFDGAARAAFDADDQLAAAFLRGLELLSKSEFNPAATQFTGALRIDPEFWPASFYLGACYAVGGRDAEAVSAWRRALLAREKLPLEYHVLSDALARSGDVQQAVPPLREALGAWPNDDGLRRRLAMAESVAQRHKEALTVIEPYLARHAGDHEALLVALQAIYATQLTGKPLVSPDADRELMVKYSRAYVEAKGPYDAIVTRWAAFVTRQSATQ